MIGYRIKTYHLYTNSFILTMLQLPKNFGMFVILGGFLVVYHAVATVFWPILALSPTILFSFITFAWVFYGWRQVKMNVSDETEVKRYEL